MEKKTIGTFLAALRKASGMTQRELAEKLGVSDKAVSRWERDECAPDLSLIPVLAEIFGVTSDEILRGQRQSPQAQPIAPEKTEKQVANLLKRSLADFQTGSIMALAVGLVGLICAMVLNLGFLRARLGFFLGLFFYLASGMYQTILWQNLKTALDCGDFSPEQLARGRKTGGEICQGIYCTDFLLLAVTMPLLAVEDTYMGLSGQSWMMWGAIWTLVAGALALAIVTFWNFRRGWWKKPDLTLPQNRLRLRWGKILALILVVTALGHLILYTWMESSDFHRLFGTSFDTWEDFQAYMETPNADSNQNFSITLPDYAEGDFTETIYGKDNQVLCQFQWRNHRVVMICSGDTENRLPVTTLTDSQRSLAIQRKSQVHQGMALVYLGECLGAFFLYRRGKKQRSL